MWALNWTAVGARRLAHTCYPRSGTRSHCTAEQ